MAETSSPEDVPRQALAALVRMVLTYRLLTLLVSTIYLALAGADPLLAWVLVGVGIANLVPVLRWDRLAPSLLRHPTILAIDFLVTIMILLVTGIDGPLLLYTLGTAFIAGVMYGWTGAVVFAGLLVAAYGALLAHTPPEAVSRDFQTVAGAPSLYVLLGLGAAAVRALLLRQAYVEAALRVAREQAAHGEERARLARELHDTLGKTLHGIVLLSDALPGWVRRDPQRAMREARGLADAARSAAAQARELLVDMRADRLDRPFGEVVRRTVAAWAEELAVAPRVDLEIDPMPALNADQRIELLAVLREALRNVERHAQAGRVWVQLVDSGDIAVLRVRDDGRGISGSVEPERLAAHGHFGLLGMQEWMERVGGILSITANRPGGVVIAAEVPAGSARAVHAPRPLAGTGSTP